MWTGVASEPKVKDWLSRTLDLLWRRKLAEAIATAIVEYGREKKGSGEGVEEREKIYLSLAELLLDP